MLRIDGMRVRRGGFVLEADLTVETGATVAVIGPSGGGKSTLLSAVAGFVPLEAGTVAWDGADLTALAPGARPVALMFQDNNLFPHLTVAQNVGLALRPSLRPTPEERDRVAAVLEQVGLGGFGPRMPGDLSGGQQSRAGLARVLVWGRPLVLMDEPFGALGPGLKTEMLDLVAETLGAAGRTVLMVTHDPADARRVASGVIVVAEGRASGPFETAPLLDDPPASLRRYLGG